MDNIINYLKKYVLYLLAVIFIAFVGVIFIIQYEMEKNISIIADGKIVYEHIQLTAPTHGIVQEIFIKEGELVERGTILMRMSNTLTDEDLIRLQKNVDLSRQNLEQLRSSYIMGEQNKIKESDDQETINAARIKMERMNILYEMGAVSAIKRNEAVEAYENIQADLKAKHQNSTYSPPPESLYDAELQVKRAEALLQKAHENTGQIDIVAPEKGIIYLLNTTTKNTNETGDVLVDLQAVENLWIEAEVTSENAEKIYLGQLVTYEIDNISIKGTVQEISTIMDENKEAGLKSIRISIPQNYMDLNKSMDHIKLYFSV